MNIPQAVQKAFKVTAPGRGELVFAPGFPGFAGHFPERPVVPGVVLALAAQLLAEAAAGRPLRLVRLVRARFFRQFGPGDTAELELESISPRLRRCRVGLAGERAAELELEVEDAAC